VPSRAAGEESADRAPLLARQGLRATRSGGHYAVEQVVRAHRPTAPAPDEAAQAIDIGQRLISAAKAFIGEPSFSR
jgi:hypothetical protein